MNNISRRKLLLTSFGATAGAFLSPGSVNAEEEAFAYKGGLVTGHPEPLHYRFIPGFLSEEQLKIHHSAHYGGALRGYIAADTKLQSSIVEATEIDSSAYGAIQRARTNKADSVILHELYFNGMIPETVNPTGEIQTAIKKRFGSIEKWAADFRASAKSASGWAILAHHQLNGKLYNVISDKHATGVLWMATPLVVIDVYEHAYYVDYENKKTSYIEKFMEHINWGEVNQRFTGIS